MRAEQHLFALADLHRNSHYYASIWTRYKFQLQPEEVSLLQAALSPEVHDNEDVGWEEITE
eukprot:scaffold293156_cov21-Tisochrysis_lutea.AAC.1